MPAISKRATPPFGLARSPSDHDRHDTSRGRYLICNCRRNHDPPMIARDESNEDSAEASPDDVPRGETAQLVIPLNRARTDTCRPCVTTIHSVERELEHQDCEDEAQERGVSIRDNQLVLSSAWAAGQTETRSCSLTLEDNKDEIRERDRNKDGVPSADTADTGESSLVIRPSFEWDRPIRPRIMHANLKNSLVRSSLRHAWKLSLSSSNRDCPRKVDRAIPRIQDPNYCFDRGRNTLSNALEIQVPLIR
ncbi:hypothetical protein HN011_009773 [Eciton burchellii]|nr:hypothetical protein HN011_009773 [Eciton burchellii]